jgi:hypothetical protein
MEKTYFALKLAGVSPEDPAMAAARRLIRAGGGPVAANVFTKITLALFGEYDWVGVPSMPVEIMLLPRWFYFNIYEVSYWSRTVIVPLLILMDKKPVKRLPPGLRLVELWPVPRERSNLRLKRTRRPVSWKNFFIAVDDTLKFWERRGPRPLRGRAVESGPALARGTPRGAGRARRHLPGHGQCGARPARARGRTIEMTPLTEKSRKSIQAPGERDFERLEAVLAPDVRFRGLITMGPFEENGAADAAARFRAWYGEADSLEVLHTDTTEVADRFRVTYRLRVSGKKPAGDGVHLIEQHVFGDVGDDGITALDLLCSGFRREHVPVG